MKFENYKAPYVVRQPTVKIARREHLEDEPVDDLEVARRLAQYERLLVRR